MRPKKTEIVRKRTGCQRCRTKKRKCDEAQPECRACTQRGIPCVYPNRIRFKDVSDETAETSRRVEAARWSLLQSRDAPRPDTLARDSPTPGQHQGESSAEEGLGQVFDDLIEETFDEVSPPSTAEVGDATAFAQDLRSIFEQQALGFLGNEAPDDGMECAPPSMSPPMSAFPWARTMFDVAPDYGEIVPGVPDLTRRLFPSLAPDSREALAIWSAPDDGPSAWDDLLDLPQASRSQTPVTSSALSTRTRQRNATRSEEALLATFENEISHRIALQIPFTQLFRTSSGLRAAALALANAHHRLCSRHGDATPTARSSGSQESPASPFRCHYYDFAVADLSHQLQCPSQEAGDALVGTCILLIYRDLALGSHRDVCGHLRQLEIISSIIDLASYCTPALLRAWRILSFDLSMRSLPTRKSIAGAFPPASGPAWDSQMTIRDIFSSLWRLHSRAAMEASFSEPGRPSRPSASRRAVQWLCSVLGRRCDRRQWEQRDYHDETLSAEAILSQCGMYEERLSIWHRSIAKDDLPVPSIGTTADAIMSGGTFGAIVAYEVADRARAIDYVLYLISRMICSYIQSSYGAQDPGHMPGFASEALARIALGILLNLGPTQPAAFGEPHVLSLLYMVAMLSEGAVIGNAILDGLFPVFRKEGLGNTESAEMRYIERLIDLIVRERHAGRSIRLLLDGADEDHKVPAVFMARTRRAVVFGDFNGRGRFRDVLMH